MKTYASRARRKRGPTLASLRAGGVSGGVGKKRKRDAAALLMATARQAARRRQHVPRGMRQTARRAKRGADTAQRAAEAKVQPRRLRQLFIDAGQRGATTMTCPECGLLYNPGQPEDERCHRAYHNRYGRGVAFNGWKSECVADGSVAPGARVIVLDPAHPLSHVRDKAREVLDLMNRDLGGDLQSDLQPPSRTSSVAKLFADAAGSPTSSSSPGDQSTASSASTLYAYVLNKRIVGALIVRRITTAYPLYTPTGKTGGGATSHQSSPAGENVNSINPNAAVTPTSPDPTAKLLPTTPATQARALDPVASPPASSPRRPPALSTPVAARTALSPRTPSSAVRISTSRPTSAWLGVDKVWVHRLHRRQGIASRLLSVARDKLIYGMRVPVDKVAFSQPTQLGQMFASSYTDDDNFLVFR